jgi:hypothetical protein
MVKKPGNGRNGRRRGADHHGVRILPAHELGWHTEAASDMANLQYWAAAILVVYFRACMAGSLQEPTAEDRQTR